MGLLFLETHVGCPMLSDSYNRHMPQPSGEKSFQRIDAFNEVSRYNDTDLFYTIVHYFCIKDQLKILNHW